MKRFTYFNFFFFCSINFPSSRLLTKETLQAERDNLAVVIKLVIILFIYLFLEEPEMSLDMQIKMKDSSTSPSNQPKQRQQTCWSDYMCSTICSLCKKTVT